MKCFLQVLVVTGLFVAPALAREWRFRNDDPSIEGELVDVKDGDVLLKTEDGEEVSVPLNTLSLGDVRYVNDALKAAEAGVTGSKKGLVAKKPPAMRTPKPAKVDVSKLHYVWKQGETYVYHLKITGLRGRDTEDRTGDITYKVKSIQRDAVQLAMTSDLKLDSSSIPRTAVLLPGRHVGFVSDVDRRKEVLVTIDQHGKLLESKGQAPLPFLMGDLSELAFEPLPLAPKTSWTITGDPGVAVVSVSYPFWRFSMAGYREGVPAEEKTVYTVVKKADHVITIDKHYEMTTAAVIAGKPRIEAKGEGKLTFDTRRAAFASLDFNMKVTVRDGNKTEETPLKITYQLLTDEEVAKAAKAAEEKKKEDEKAKAEKLRPLTPKETAVALADLSSGDRARVSSSLKLFVEKKPEKPDAQVARVLETLMLKGDDGGTRCNAAQALKHWGNAESVPALIKALSDPWSPVQAHAIETMSEDPPKQAIKQVAPLLRDGMTRGPAAKFLKAAGADAEDAVLLCFDTTDAWTGATICEILTTIGTKKSLPMLEKALLHESWMVNGNARKAINAIKLREASK